MADERAKMPFQDETPENFISDGYVNDPADIQSQPYLMTNPAACSIFRGFVEKLHPKYLENGLVKVRIPLIHMETGIENIPYAHLTQTLLSWCNTWNTPKTNKNNVELHVKGDGSIDGDLELKTDMMGMSLVANATVSQSPSPFGNVGFGTQATGPIKNTGAGKISGDCELDVKTDDFDKCDITPKEYDVRPFNFHREGEDLIRVGDEVLVVSIMRNLNDLIVVEILNFKK